MKCNKTHLLALANQQGINVDRIFPSGTLLDANGDRWKEKNGALENVTVLPQLECVDACIAGSIGREYDGGCF